MTRKPRICLHCGGEGHHDDGRICELCHGTKSPDIPVKEYSGRIALRIPKELHRQLAETASTEGVSMNQLILYKLARSMKVHRTIKKPKR